jgi:arylsulfatase A-like enzyme
LTSDHGEAFLEHGFVLHSIKLYPEFLQVPLVIFDPRNPVAKVSQKPASIVDIKPTILDLLGMEIEPDMDGISLVREVDDARYRFAEVCFDPGASNRLLRAGIVTIEDVSSKMIVQKKKHLIFNDQRGTFELYDVASDPQMLTNLIDRDPGEAARLKAELGKWIASTHMGYDKPSIRRIRPVEKGLSREQVAQLKSLGYIGSEK